MREVRRDVRLLKDGMQQIVGMLDTLIERGDRQ
jgi:hypothetical protein